MKQQPERERSSSARHPTDRVRVAVVACEDYGLHRLHASIATGLDYFGGLNAFVKPGEKVLLKPNLFAAVRPRHGLTTHPDFVRVLCSMIQDAGAHAFVGDNPVFGFKSLTYLRTGMSRAIKGTDARLVNLNKTERVDCPQGRRARSFPLPTNLSTFDRIISLPKLKTHNLMGLTAAVKNAYGLVHGRGARKKLHFAHPDPADFAQMLLDLNTLVRPCLFVADAVIGSDGNGPRFGTPKPVGYVVMGTDALGVDFVLAKMAGVPAERVCTLQAAMEREDWSDPFARIEILGASLEQACRETFAFPPEPGGTVSKLPRPVREALIRYSKRSEG